MESNNYYNNDYRRANNNQTLHISTPRTGSISGVSSVSSYSSNGSIGYHTNNYNSSPISSPTYTGRPPFAFTTSDRAGRINSPTSPPSTSPPTTLSAPISFTPNYPHHGLPSPPIHSTMTQSTPPSNLMSYALPVPAVYTPGGSSGSSYGNTVYTSSSYGVDVRNSYPEYSSSYGSQDNVSAVQMQPSESSTTTSTFIPRDIIFPPTEEALAVAENELVECKSSFRVIYAGDASYKETGGLYNRSKRTHFVLTNNLLLHYKNAQKARSYIDMFEQTTAPKLDNEHIFLDLAHVYAVQATTMVANTFRIEYINSKSGIALHHKITVDSDKEMKKWVKALRRAIKVHHPQINSITSTERYNAHDRMKKQNDLFENQNENKVFKVVYKELNYKVANESPKELFLPMLLSIGKFSFYLTPLVLKDQVYEKAIKRDRFGLLSIQSIRYEDIDDTIILDIKQIGKPNLQLAFASTFCESIVQHLHRGVQALIPAIAASLYDRKVPPHIKNTRVIQLYIHPDPGDAVTDDEEVQRFHTVLRAYSAAMNLNKLRFNFLIHGPMKAKVFTLLQPHEVNQTPSTYDKFELLAIIKTVQYNNIFAEVSFANQPLNVLEKWERKEKEGWAFSKQHRLKDSNILANEIYNMLTNLDSLLKIDLTNCSVGTHIQENSSVAQNSALAQIGHIMKLGKTNINRICIGKNKLTENDFGKLVQGIREHKQPIKELRLEECGLEKDMLENILKALYDKQPEQLIILDLSLSPNQQGNTVINHLLTEKLVTKFTGLESLYMRGHNLLDLNYCFMLETSDLSVLDISNCKMNTENIQRLCHWIQSRSFDNMKELHLGNCNLTGKHATDILNSISLAKNKVIHLNLENNPLMKNPGYLLQLVTALTRKPGPTSLCLARIKFDDYALRELVEGLTTNQSITHLDLSDISISDTDEISAETVRQLTLLFERNRTLKSLDLHYSHIKAKHLSFSAMQTKSLFGNAITKAFQGLRNNTTLNHLNISGMNLEDTGALALCRALEHNKGLQSILLDENNISIEGYRKLSKVIEDIATQVIHVPHPYIDLRNQLKYLLFRVEELLVSENEARFFLIHATGGDATRATRHKLEMIHDEMKSSQLAIKNFTGVLEKLRHVVQRNLRDYEKRKVEFGYRRQSYGDDDGVWEHPGYQYEGNSPHGSVRGSISRGSSSPHIRRVPTNISVSSGSSTRSSQHHKPNAVEYVVTSPPPFVESSRRRSYNESIYQETTMPPTPLPPTDNGRRLELESIIEQQRQILMQLEIERQRLQAQQVPHYQENSQQQIYPPYEYQQANLNYSDESFSYADSFVQSYSDLNTRHLPPDTRD